MTKKTEAKPTCGIVMPISEIDGCDTTHWKNVYEILKDAAETAGFTARLVSDSDDIGVIQANIIQSLYDSDIVLCDVSGKNANVMFELGLRLAFDKPVVVVKDDKTGYSFDTSPIEHLDYPRSLHFQKVLDFKAGLEGKLKKTCEAARDPNYKSFLKYFGKFEVAGLSTSEIARDDYIVREIQSLKNMFTTMSRSISNAADSTGSIGTGVRGSQSLRYKNIVRALVPIIYEKIEDNFWDEGDFQNAGDSLIKQISLELEETSPELLEVKYLPPEILKEMIKDALFACRRNIAHQELNTS